MVLESPGEHAGVARGLKGMAAAYRRAADDLEKEELALLEQVGRVDIARPETL